MKLIAVNIISFQKGIDENVLFFYDHTSARVLVSVSMVV